MPVPRVRFTVRRLMIAVAVGAAILAAMAEAERCGRRKVEAAGRALAEALGTHPGQTRFRLLPPEPE